MEATMIVDSSKAFVDLNGETVNIDLEEEFETLREELQEDAEGQTKKLSVDLPGLKICCKVATSSLCLCLLYALVSIAMVVIGSLYLKDCPVQPYIPIYLVVGGAFGLFKNFISAFRKRVKISYFVWILNLFLFIWFILGCVWVYSVRHVEFNVTSDPDYCHKTCFNFAYYMLNTIFVVIVAVLGVTCCCGCCAACCLRRDHTEQATHCGRGRHLVKISELL